MPERFDPERPAVARKLELIPELEKVAAQAGVPLTHLALGFVLAHPAVSSAIIGPRTMDQLEGLLDAGDVSLDDDTLDVIDGLVPPGTTINEGESGWMAPAVAQAWRRRRPLGAR
jgi:aryl-alcohol dehydrogenase (NADP+)